MDRTKAQESGGAAPLGSAAGLYFYYRDGCHLCEELASLLMRGWPERFGQLQWRDVDSRPDWREQYGPRVPVLLWNGNTISELLPSPDTLRDHFGAPANPL